MALGRIAVVEAGGLLANEAVIAATTAGMCLKTDLGAPPKLIHRVPESDYGAGPLMPRCKGAIR